MGLHFESRSVGRDGKFSKLDWPTLETLMPAHRARGQELRTMILALGRGIKSWVVKFARPSNVARNAEITTRVETSAR